GKLGLEYPHHDHAPVLIFSDLALVPSLPSPPSLSPSLSFSPPPFFLSPFLSFFFSSSFLFSLFLPPSSPPPFPSPFSFFLLFP
ncbi:hypothetical protein ACXWR7_11655, partial [Streptococcus pyogenes]